jgi:Acetyltransferase (GNAT) domain
VPSAATKRAAAPRQNLPVRVGRPSEDKSVLPHDGSLSVKVLQTPTEILEHRFLWNSWPGSRDSDLDFFLYIVSARPEVLCPYVLVAYRRDLPEAVLIGRLEQRRVPVKFGYLHFPTPLVRVLDFVYGGLRGNASPENTAVLISKVLKSLRDGEADLAVFEHLPVHSHLYHAVDVLPGALERGISPEHRTHRRLQLPENSDALHTILSPKHRQNYRRKARKLLRDFSGAVHIERYSQVSDLMVGEVESIARKTYQRGLGFGFKDTPEIRGQWELAAAKGWLRVSILYVAGKPCAYWIAMAYNRVLWGDHVGYDPAYSSYSPGMHLLLSCLSDLCDRKWDDDITEIDFGLGDAEYKSLLSNCCFKEGLVYIYGRTLRGLGVNLLSTPVLLADRLVRKFLTQKNLIAKVKRFWRKHEAPASH